MAWNGQTAWEMLGNESRPILLYGMGDGADKILSVFSEKDPGVRGFCER